MQDVLAFRAGVLRPRKRGRVSSAQIAHAVATRPASPTASNYGCSDGKGVSHVDVAVIGSGIGGLCAATLLARCEMPLTRASSNV